jgi:tetratricopeptide (TPR) repeat protein
VKAIYDAALRHHPDHPDVLTSLAIDAAENAERAEGDAAAALWRTAHTAAERALAVAPTDAHGWFVRGRVRYDDPAVPVTDALADLEAAVQLDPTHGEARMFVGHSLRDLHRWDEAAAAFAAVDRAAVVYDAYRVDELQADCLLRAGRVEEATARFAAALDAMEPLEDIWFGELLFDAAAAGALPALADRVAALRQRLEG